MKKLLLTSFLFLAAAGTMMAQNRKPNKLKLQKSKTDRVAIQNQRLAEKKAAKLQSNDTQPEAQKNDRLAKRRAAARTTPAPNSREAMQVEKVPAARQSESANTNH